ncbi:MAG: geranylgeranylglyceryl/heptaprenylglyceryl phosphate synthase [Halolamina sp.]|uniref:geranylgeranylglyceryl/heptaprenylglyceryl phosphate synthase n=1 Tax=Halolamina sp. TaxID=1940283 RepID=UPI002FC2C179
MRRDFAARAERLADLVGVLARSALDSNPVPADWQHVTKIDPEGAKKLPLLYPLWLSETDALSVGGSADVTPGNTEAAFDLLTGLETPLCHEPSGADHVTERSQEVADLLLVPEVLNGGSEALVGTLGVAIESVREQLAPALVRDKASWLPAGIADYLADISTTLLLSQAAFEAYIVQNPDSAAAREAGVTEADVLSPRGAKQRAMAADRHLDSEILYLEYSGTFGGDGAVETLELLDDALIRSRIWYGGGLADTEDVAQVRDAGADTVVVGDAFHDVAEAEAELLRAAEMELPRHADGEAIREWTAARIDAESPGAGFLSTIPAVDDPVLLAREYTGATVRAWLELRDRHERAQASDESELGVIEVHPTVLRAAIAPVVDRDADELAATITRAALAGRSESDSEDAVENTAEQLNTSLLAERE